MTKPKLRKEITERGEPEALLRAANERVEMVLDSITDKFFAIDSQWRYTYFNKHAEEQLNALGKNPASLIGKVLWDTFPNASSGEQLRHAMHERVVMIYEDYEPSLGEWFENRIYPSPDGGLAIFQRYVTERKRAEEALRESEERFRRCFELGLIGMAITSPEKGCLEVNDELCRILGYQRSELLSMSWAEITHPDDLAADVAQFNRVVAGEIDGYSLDKRWIRKDGRIIDSIMAAKSVRRADGSVDYFVGLVQDITKRKRAEDNLRRSEAYLAEAQHLSHTGSWAWNVSTGDLYWSEEHFRICGLDPEKDRPSYPAMQWVHTEDRSLVQETFEKAIRNRADFELDCRVVWADGTVRYVHSLAHPVFNSEGELTEYVGTIIDNTERKLAKDALLEAQAELAHVARVTALGELAASIAHEVNQPLGAIVANSSACKRLLSREPPDLVASMEAIEAIVKDALRASDVIKRTYAFVKKAVSEKVPMNINEAIRGVISLVASELVKDQISLRTELEEDLPRVMGDRVQLQQVVLNLSLNGIEAMSGNGWQPRELLITSRKSNAGQIVVAVADSGTGLDPQNREVLFNAYFTTKPGGLGLGLAISRTIIQTHGGKLWATTNDSGGATFQFSLPTTAKIG